MTSIQVLEFAGRSVWLRLCRAVSAPERQSREQSAAARVEVKSLFYKTADSWRPTTFLLSAFCCLLCLRSLQATVVNVKNLGALGDGVTDDLSAINTALAQGCSTGNSVYFPAGTYRVSSPLNSISCSMTVYGDGSSSSIVKLGGRGSSNYSPLFNFSGASNTVVVHDLGLQGQHVHAVGLQLQPLNTAHIYNVIIQNFGTPGYSAGNQIEEDGLYANTVQNLIVANSVIMGNERSGIEMIPVTNATISGNIINGNGYYAGVAEWQDPTGTAGPLNVQFLNNIARNNGSGGFDVETGSNLPTAYGKIHGNDIEDNGFDMWTYGIGAVIGNHAYGEISNNIVHNFNQVGPKYSGYGTAVIATPWGSMNLTNNYISNSSDYGVIVNGTRGSAAITGNWTSFNPTAGLDVNTFSGGSTINNNYSFNNGGPAFQISGCSGCITSPNFSSPPNDATPPSVPTGLTPSVASRDQINLSWTDSIDNIGVMGYYVYRNGVKIATTAGTQYPDTGLSAGTQYTYTVAAFDGSGNVSAQSPGVPATTLGGSGSPPSPCDVNGDGVINVVDVQLDVNAALGTISCTPTYDINKDGLCNVIDVQRVVNAALGGPCTTSP